MISGLKHLKKLRSLSLNLSDNSIVNEAFENFVSNQEVKNVLGGLLELRLDLNNNVVGNSFFKFLFDEMSLITALRILKLNFGRTLADHETIKLLGNWMSKLFRLNLFDLSMEKIKFRDDNWLDPISNALSGMQNLKALKLNLAETNLKD